MKVKKDWPEILIYWGVCLCSLGLIYVFRIVLTQAIKKAIEHTEPQDAHREYGKL